MPNANNLKRGMCVTIKGELYKVVNVDVQTPSSRGATTLYKVRYTNLKTKLKLEETYKGGDFIDEADLIRRKCDYSYAEGDLFYFMDTETYEQYSLGKEQLGDDTVWINEDLKDILVLVLDENAIGLELPDEIDLKVVETDPVVKGSYGSGRSKPAKLSNGLEVQVPEHIATGDMVKIESSSRKFVAKA